MAVGLEVGAMAVGLEEVERVVVGREGMAAVQAIPTLLLSAAKQRLSPGQMHLYGCSCRWTCG